MRKYIIGLIILGLVEIGLSLYLTFWREHFWQAIAVKAGSAFMNDIIIFTVVALLMCATTGLTTYFINMAAIKWRHKLTARIKTVDVENYSQRVQEDTIKYPTLCLTLGFGLGRALVYVLTFSIALVSSFGWWYLWVLLGYTLIGTVVARFIARPLISLNYESQRAEATYRQELIPTNFNTCIYILTGLARKQKHLSYFQSFFAQLGVVLPVLLIAPAYFLGAMDIGLLMRFSSTAGNILDNLSYGISSFAQYNEYIASHRRLKGVL